MRRDGGGYRERQRWGTMHNALKGVPLGRHLRFARTGRDPPGARPVHRAPRRRLARGRQEPHQGPTGDPDRRRAPALVAPGARRARAAARRIDHRRRGRPLRRRRRHLHQRHLRPRLRVRRLRRQRAPRLLRRAGGAGHRRGSRRHARADAGRDGRRVRSLCAHRPPGFAGPAQRRLATARGAGQLRRRGHRRAAVRAGRGADLQRAGHRAQPCQRADRIRVHRRLDQACARRHRGAQRHRVGRTRARRRHRPAPLPHRPARPVCDLHPQERDR